jgi:uncharacterized protein YkwD
MPDSRHLRTLISIITLLGVPFLALSLPNHAAAADCRDGDVAAGAQSADSAEAAVVCEINQQRRRHGLDGLDRHRALARAGGRHAADMVRRSYFSHVSPGGQTFAERLRAAGYAANRGWAAGEVLAWGTGGRSTPEAIVAAWMRSSGHRRVLLGSRYREVGVGLARGNPVSGADGATYAAALGVTDR